MSTNAPVTDVPWLLLCVVFVLLVGGVGLYSVVQKESHSWYAMRSSWWEYLFGGSPHDPTAAAVMAVQDTTSPLSPEAPLKTQTNSLPTAPGETWCFLGEDATGRWCVKVPLPSLCEPSRSYGGRDPCEMTLAQQLPLGLVPSVSAGNPRPPASATIAQARATAINTPSASLSKVGSH